MKRTFSDEEYAKALRGSASPSDIEWLHRHLRGDTEPRLPGFKAGRKWRATEDDIDQAIELLRPKRVAVPVVPAASSMTRTSRRRLSA
ncbi:hypothetical protein [Mycobacterium aquaticum]|uniref:Uncharacterized protein n=1 Tax=Mycobacterium aquaticum TaxID=1927124 RepID=A0A1X0A560_9MYCO|nr:hypothetical protein [Mycobacterium aquaticum]ORA25207.1 hypothetical protein BST13_33345 [Mycobacterium aquaticum]